MYSIYALSYEKYSQIKKLDVLIVKALISTNETELGRINISYKTLNLDQDKKQPIQVPFFNPDMIIFEIAKSQDALLAGSLPFKEIRFFSPIQIILNPTSKSNLSGPFVLNIVIVPAFPLTISLETPPQDYYMSYIYFSYKPPLDNPNKISFSLNYTTGEGMESTISLNEESKERGLTIFKPPFSMLYTETGWTPVFIINSKEFSYSDFHFVIKSLGYEGSVSINYLITNPDIPNSEIILHEHDTLSFNKQCNQGEGSTLIKVHNHPATLKRTIMNFNYKYSLKSLTKSIFHTITQPLIFSTSGYGIYDSSYRSIQISLYAFAKDRPDTEDFVDSNHQLCLKGKIEYQESNAFRTNQILLDLNDFPQKYNMIVVYLSLFPKTSIRKTKRIHLKIKDSSNFELLFIDLDNLPPQEGETGNEEGIIATILYNDAQSGWTIMPPSCFIHGEFQTLEFDIIDKIYDHLKTLKDKFDTIESFK